MPRSSQEQYDSLPLEVRLAHWRGGITPPRLCECCRHYDGRGTCALFRSAVPQDFRESEGECDSFDHLPF